jgi:uncharacterized repeat protein (TIGR03803 family)
MGAPDGYAPWGLYGMTSEGGTSGSGSVFKITPAGVETVLHSFAGGTHRAVPFGSLFVQRETRLQLQSFGKLPQALVIGCSVVPETGVSGSHHPDCCRGNSNQLLINDSRSDNRIRIHVLTKSRTDGREYRIREVRIATVMVATWITRTAMKPTPCRKPQVPPNP